MENYLVMPPINSVLRNCEIYVKVSKLIIDTDTKADDFNEDAYFELYKVRHIALENIYEIVKTD